MGSQQFCLKWNNHQTNLLNVFEQLLQNEAFVDVTLACEGLSLKAHKMVLSACSPYFQGLFLENPCKHPIVILNNIKYSDLKAIIDFMYKGEVNVSQEQLSALLKTAELLKVKGLAEVTNQTTQSLNPQMTETIPTHGPGSPSTQNSTQHRNSSSPPPKRKKIRSSVVSSAANSPQTPVSVSNNSVLNQPKNMPSDPSAVALDIKNEPHVVPVIAELSQEEHSTNHDRHSDQNTDQPPDLMLEHSPENADDHSSLSNITADITYDHSTADYSGQDHSGPPDITNSVQAIPSTSGMQSSNQEISWSRSDILMPMVEYTSPTLSWLKQDTFTSALAAVRSGHLSISNVAHSIGMGHKNIHKQLGLPTFSKLPLKRGPKTLLTEEEEKAVVDYIHSFTGRGTRPRRDEIIRYASSILQQKTGTGMSSSDDAVESMKTKVGIKWWKKFRARHPELRDMRGNIPRERPVINND